MLIFCVNLLITDSAKNMYILVIVSITRVNLVAFIVLKAKVQGEKGTKNMKHTSFLQKKQNDIMLINRPISKILTLDTFKKDIIYSAANFVNILISVLLL